MSTDLLEKRSISTQLYKKMCQDIPGGVNSPVRSFPGLQCSPLIVESGLGSMIYDMDGNGFIDYCCSWGAIIHGHADPRIVEAVQKRVALGCSFGISTQEEAKLASKMKQFLPNLEKVRFVSSGTEATMSAVRLARGFTSRNLMIKFSGNYHGHSDSFLIQAGSGVFNLNPSSSSAGVPEEAVKNTISLPYNDIEAFYRCIKELKNQIACVILEPIAANMGLVPAHKEFIQVLREETAQAGIVLIFDEVISGFRLGLQGAQGYFGAIPDLSCFGKIIGGGFPAAAFGGRAEIMDFLAPLGPVYQAGTLSGNPVAMEAGYQTLCLLENQPELYNELDQKARIISEPVQEFIEERNLNMSMVQLGSLFTLFFGSRKIDSREDAKQLDLKTFATFFNYLLERGIYWVPSQYEANFLSSAHTTSQLEYTRDAVLSFLETL